MAYLRRLTYFLLDRIWPTLERVKSPKKEVLPVVSVHLIEEASTTINDLLKEQYDAVDSIEKRLQSLLFLSSLVGALIAAAIGMTFGLSEENIDLPPILYAPALYVVLQMVRALFAVRSGLERRSYDAISLLRSVPRPSESSEDYRKRILTAKLKVLGSWRDQCNYKTSQLALAHAALTNVLGATLIVSVLLAVILLLSFLDLSLGQIINAAKELVKSASSPSE